MKLFHAVFPLAQLVLSGLSFVSAQPPPQNILAGIVATSTKCCSYEGCSSAVTDGLLDNRATGSNCGNTQELIYDLVSSKSPSKLSYVYCKNPGFTNGAVSEFKLYSSDTSADGPWSLAVEGYIPEDTSSSMRGVSLVFDLPSNLNGRFWKWNAVTNHGNNNYIWTCEIQLYESLVPIESPRTVYDHLVCYKIKVPDEFWFEAAMDMVANEKQKDYTVGECKLAPKGKAEFCVPAHKKLTSVPEKLMDIQSVYDVTAQDLKNDFFCYQFKECSELPPIKNQMAVDQFGKKEFTINKWSKRRPKICVPAWKMLKDSTGQVDLVEI